MGPLPLTCSARHGQRLQDARRLARRHDDGLQRRTGLQVGVGGARRRVDVDVVGVVERAVLAGRKVVGAALARAKARRARQVGKGCEPDVHVVVLVRIKRVHVQRQQLSH